MTAPAAQPSLSVAVVMCTYNGERFIAEQLHSIFSQTRPPDHLVIVDDVSTDDTYRLVEQLCAQRPSGMRLTLQRNACNLGYVANFDRALGLADEDLLFLCDQDDVWHPGKIERMEREFIARPDLDLLHTDARLVGANGASLGCGLFEALEVTAEERRALHQGQGFRVLLRRNVVTGATSAARRSVIRRASPFPELWVHDEWIAVVAAIGGCIDCLEEMLIDYRQHGGNQIGVQKRSIHGRNVAPGGRRLFLQRVQARLATLSSELEQRELRVGAEQSQALEDRLRHARVRAYLPGELLARLLAVVVEAARGGYRRHGFGLRSAVADLLGLD
jgi:glycosyltransferase involved in cell wall biosynthesis